MMLEDTAWRLESFASATLVTPVITGTEITLSFTVTATGTSTIAGSGGCNRYFAGYTASGDTLSIDPIASTRMMCAEDVSEQESRYFQALQAVYRFEMRGDTMVLLCADGELRFARADV